jgi:hypothetical protein
MFKNKEELKISLLEKIRNLKPEYNIYLHEIYPFGYKEETIAKFILNGGLDCYKYVSFLRTMSFQGNNKDVDMDKIINYFYADNGLNRHIIVFATVKELELEDKKIDFSTPIINKYDHKSSMMDILTKDQVSKENILGYLHIDDAKGIYEFKENDNHFSTFSDDEKKIYYSQKIAEYNSVCEKHNTTDICSLLLEATKLAKANQIEYNAFEI